MALHPVNILSFCSGIGGLDLGLKRAIGPQARVVAHVEGEMYAAAVLAARMQDGTIHDAPIWSDVKTFDAAAWRGCVDILTAGYPCQPFSAAGKRRGADDPRHLWPYIAAHIRAIRPAVVFCENVPGHLSLGFEQVCQDLSAMGYSIEAGVFSAAEIGAPHLRKRLFFVAYTDSRNLRNAADIKRDCGGHTAVQPLHDGNEQFVADTDAMRQLQPQRRKQNVWGRPCDCCGNVANTKGINGGDQKNSTWHKQRNTAGGSCGKVANADYTGLAFRQSVTANNAAQCEATERDSSGASQQYMANADSIRREQGQPETALQFRGHGADCCCSCGCACGGQAQRNMGRDAHGFTCRLDHNPWADGWEDGIPRVTTGQPHRIDRLRALGNAVVPGVATLAWNTLVHQALSRDTIPHAQIENAVST